MWIIHGAKPLIDQRRTTKRVSVVRYMRAAEPRTHVACHFGAGALTRHHRSPESQLPQSSTSALVDT